MHQKFALLLAPLALTSAASAQVVYSTAASTYSQAFTSLGSAWTNNSTIAGWSLLQGVSSGAGPDFSQPTGFASATSPTTLTISNGSNIGGFHSYGLTSNADRALGGNPGSTAGGLLIGVQIQNTTGDTLTSATIGYAGEQWRRSANTPQITNTLYVSYSFDATSLSTGTWTRVSALDFVSPDTSSTAAAGSLGDVARQTLSITLSSLAVSNGTSLWVRFWDPNLSTAEHGMGVDDFSFTATAAAIPEPSATAALAGLGVLGLAALRRRRA